MPSVNSNKKKTKTKPLGSVTLWADDVPGENARPVLAKKARTISFVNAVVCIVALLIPFIPVSIDKKLITEPLIPNMFGVISRDLGMEANRSDAAKFLILFAVAFILIVIGLVDTYYHDRIAGLFTLSGCIILSYFSITWVSYAAILPNGVKANLKTALGETPIPAMMIIFSIGGAVTSALAFFGYSLKRDNSGLH